MALTISAVPAAPAAAAEKSAGLLGAGLIEYYAGRYEPAVELLDQAISADPDNVDARYYRAVCYNRLGQHSKAVDDLHAVLARKPGMAAASLELGRALYNLEDYDEARRWLERAERAPALAAQSLFYLGLVDLRTERYDAADDALQRAAAKDASLAAAARYYQGVARLEAGDRAGAESAFDDVVAIDPTLAVASQAAAQLRRLRADERRKYGLFGSAGFDYDTNVRLEPDQTGAVNAGDPADGRSVLTLGGWYAPVKTDKLELSFGYGFFQSLHFDLTANNLQGHRASAGISSKLGRFDYGLTGRFDYYLSWLDFNANGTGSGPARSFNVDGRVQPWITMPSVLGETEMFYRFRGRDYFYDEVGPTQDGINNAFGIRQYYPLGRRGFVLAGYRFDKEDKTQGTGAPFQYDGQSFEAGMGWQLPFAVYANALYAYKNEQYGEASRVAVGTVRRRDDEHDFSVVLRRPLNERMSLVGGYFGKIHDSTQQPFEYDRHIGSVSLELHY